MLLKKGEYKRFDYNGKEQSLELLPGIYNLKVWGANGGKSEHGIRGGYGGYAEGNVTFLVPTIIYINCGGTGKAVYGGYNGGGNGGPANSDSAGGGGATHIAISSGILQTLSTNKESVLIVAGGGGASGCSDTIGGAGGGEIGQTAQGTSYGGAATGGTQTSGGIGGLNENNTRNNGSFGKGANSLLSYSWPGGGGGGGWYGGGAGGNQSGGGGTAGGGSGYIGGVTDGKMSTGVNNGSGYAIITALDIFKDIFNLHKNSNFYRDSYYQEYFDFNKLLEV